MESIKKRLLHGLMPLGFFAKESADIDPSGQRNTMPLSCLCNCQISWVEYQKRLCLASVSCARQLGSQRNANADNSKRGFSHPEVLFVYRCSTELTAARFAQTDLPHKLHIFSAEIEYQEESWSNTYIESHLQNPWFCRNDLRAAKLRIRWNQIRYTGLREISKAWGERKYFARYKMAISNESKAPAIQENKKSTIAQPCTWLPIF